jgi:hypothetical protein
MFENLQQMPVTAGMADPTLTVTMFGEARMVYVYKISSFWHQDYVGM